MKIRITGTREQCAEFTAKLRTSGICEVLAVSNFRPWTRNDPASKIGSVYIEAALDGGYIIDITPESAPVKDCLHLTDEQLKIAFTELMKRIGEGDRP